MRINGRSLGLAAAGVLLALSTVAGCGTDGAESPSDQTSTETDAATAPAGAAFDPCTALTVAEVGAVLGGTVTARPVPGGGCLFSQDDPRATSISVTEGEPATSGGGIQSSKIGAESQIDGKAESLSGVGDAAYIVVGKGKMIPTESIQAAGGVVAKGQLITVALVQGQGLPAAQVTKLITDTVTLIARKA